MLSLSLVLIWICPVHSGGSVHFASGIQMVTFHFSCLCQLSRLTLSFPCLDSGLPVLPFLLHTLQNVLWCFRCPQAPLGPNPPQPNGKKKRSPRSLSSSLLHDLPSLNATTSSAPAASRYTMPCHAMLCHPRAYRCCTMPCNANAAVRGSGGYECIAGFWLYGFNCFCCAVYIALCWHPRIASFCSC